MDVIKRKSNSKSIRMTDEVLAYVESVPGDSFNQKFEDLVIDIKTKEPEREKRLAELNRLISQKQKQLATVSDKVESLDVTIQAMFSLQDEVHRIQQQIDDILNDS